jgi:hypothetical protein
MVFSSTTSAFGTNRKLDGELLSGVVRRSLEDMSEYECNE